MKKKKKKKKKERRRRRRMEINQNHRATETALAAPGPSSRARARFFGDEGGSSYFGELGEALAQIRESSSAGDAKCFSSGSSSKTAATLEIFPSFPTRVEIRRSSSDSGGGRSASMAAATTTTTTSESSLQPSSLDNKNNITGSIAAGKGGKKLDAKTLRRLAQNREAARKSRLRKKAYVQQLESSRIRLQQMEQDLQRAKSQGLMVGVGGSAINGAVSSGAAMFDTEYSRWLDDNCKHIASLRAALQSRLPDGDLSVILDDCIANYDHFFRLKALAVKSDVFHLLNGAWMTPAERCFLWIGGFRPSDLLKVLIPQLDPMTEQQLMGMYSLKQSSHQAEEALSQGLHQLHCSLIDTVAGGGGCADSISADTAAVDVGNYMSQMVVALDKLTNLEGFVRQADNLRQQMIHQLRRTLTVRQAARCFLAIGEYYTRLRALSSLWASRPQQDLVIGASTPPLQTFHHHFSPY